METEIIYYLAGFGMGTAMILGIKYVLVSSE